MCSICPAIPNISFQNTKQTKILSSKSVTLPCMSFNLKISPICLDDATCICALVLRAGIEKHSRFPVNVGDLG